MMKFSFTSAQERARSQRMQEFRVHQDQRRRLVASVVQRPSRGVAAGVDPQPGAVAGQQPLQVGHLVRQGLALARRRMIGTEQLEQHADAGFDFFPLPLVGRVHRVDNHVVFHGLHAGGDQLFLPPRRLLRRVAAVDLVGLGGDGADAAHADRPQMIHVAQRGDRIFGEWRRESLRRSSAFLRSMSVRAAS
jgi:hypothetical protein